MFDDEDYADYNEEAFYLTEAQSPYITQDTGERAEYPSGMRRDSLKDKTLWHLVADGPMLERYAALMTRGAAKYDAGNWMLADTIEERDRFKASAFRHFLQWYLGVDDDEDHGAAVWFNINGVEHVEGKLSNNVSIEHAIPGCACNRCGPATYDGGNSGS